MATTIALGLTLGACSAGTGGAGTPAAASGKIQAAAVDSPTSPVLRTSPTDSTTETTEAAEAKEAIALPQKPASIRIAWGGDVAPLGPYSKLPTDPSFILAGVRAPLAEADLGIVNLEGVLSERGPSKCGAGGPRPCYVFRAPPRFAEQVLAANGVDLVSTANNHSLDYGQISNDDTRVALAEAKVAAAGLPGEVTFVDVKGVRVAVIGMAPYAWGADLRDEKQLVSLVKKGAADADVVVLLLHVGAEGLGARHVRPGKEYAFGEDRGDPMRIARLAIDNGADLVVGSGPHVLRGMEFYKDRLIAYSLGNLAGYGKAFRTDGDFSLSGVLSVELTPKGEFASGRLHSAYLTASGVPTLDAAGRSAAAVDRLSRADFGKNAARLSKDGTISRAS